MHVSRLSDVINTRSNVTIRSSYLSDRKASFSTSEFTADSYRKTKAKIRYGFSMLCDKDGFYLPELIRAWGELCLQFYLSFSANN